MIATDSSPQQQVEAILEMFRQAGTEEDSRRRMQAFDEAFMAITRARVPGAQGQVNVAFNKLLTIMQAAAERHAHDAALSAHAIARGMTIAGANSSRKRDSVFTLWPGFVSQVGRRLERGRVQYGESSVGRPLPQLLDELEQEIQDIAGWAFLLWQRIVHLRATALEAEDPAPKPIPTEGTPPR